MKTFYIPTENFSAFEKKLNAFIKKAKKYKINFFYNVVTNCVKTVKYRVRPFLPANTFTFECVKVEVEGLIKNDNWIAIGEIEGDEDAIVLHSYNDENPIPQSYKDSSLTRCDHCKTNRLRNKCVIIYNVKENSYKQVGETCLLDYTGLSLELITATTDIFAYAKKISYYNSVGGSKSCEKLNGDYEFNSFFGGASESRNVKCNLKQFLTYTVAVVNKFGYTSKKKAQESDDLSTSELVLEGFYRTNSSINIAHELDLSESAMKKYEESANTLIEWIRTNKFEYCNEYICNMMSICDSDYFSLKYAGYVTSLYSMYNNANNKKESTDSTSKYIGKVGEKIQVELESAKLITSYDTMYGRSFMYQFTDKENNVLIWNTSKFIDTQSLLNKSLIGSVKELKEFNNVKQTVLTRCKFC